MIKLYHGSNIEITSIDLSRCKAGKDFGKGFYLNPNYSQAYDMAVRTARITGNGGPVVSSFEFDDSLLVAPGDVKIAIFSDYSEDWAEFVVNNRKYRGDGLLHDFDVVIGPIADDSVGVQIRRYIMGYIPVGELVKELRFHGDHAVQYFFGTQRAIQFLKRI